MLEDLILEVPFTSQYAEDNGLNKDWKSRACGIASLKMVLDYHLDKSIETKEMLNIALKNGGVNSNKEWYHSTLVSTAIAYGFKSWRRSWIPAEKDIKNFKEEGLDEDSLNSWKEQLKEEGVDVLESELSKGFPVLASAPPKFNDPERSHILVLNGLKYEGDDLVGFYYLDPENKSSKQLMVPINKFKSMWTYRSIFVRPQEK